MKQKYLLTVCLAGLITACSQKQSVVTVAPSQIDVESLIDSIDYAMDVSNLSLADVRTLSSAPAAQRGYPFKDAYIRGLFLTTTWYDSLMYVFDENLPWNDYPSKDDETIYQHYQRMIDEAGIMKYTDQEKQFMDRLAKREEQLRKLNFTVEKGLRVNMANLANPQQLKEFDPLLSQQLAQDGFGIVAARHNQLFQVYEQNDYDDFPNFVTTDLYLQLFHLYFDSMLRELEEKQLLQLMTEFTREMYDMSYKFYQSSAEGQPVNQAAERNCIFFNVAYKLFTGKYLRQAEPGSIAAQEVKNVMDAIDKPSTFMKDYKEISFSYSLFRPRGHYTRSEALQRYFQGMMWLQTVPFGLDHEEEVRQAVMMAYCLRANQSLGKKYERLNNFITFLMGKTDNLSITQIDLSGKPMEELFADSEAMSTLTARLNKMGNEQTRIRPKYEKTSHNKICVMPQRYQPDAEVLLNMVDYDSQPTKRATPKGLDVFAAMGVSTAERILAEEKTDWKAYGDSLKAMKKVMDATDWKESIAAQWIQTLKELNVKDSNQKLPYFMQNPEWAKKDLNATLASWAELKHDAILYAKQPAGAECGGGGPPEPIVKGYVEPNVRFWKKAIELLDSTEKLLLDEKLMTEKISGTTERIREEALFLLRCSEKELEEKELTDEEYEQIEYIGAAFENISLDIVREPDQYLMGWDDVQGADKKVALVADVYTANADNNPKKSILFEAVGEADELYVVVEIAGYLYLMRGAVLSYREFTQPIDEPRLTDEEWEQMLDKQPRKGVPEWMKRIIVPLEKQPEPNEELFYSSGC